MSRKFLKFFSSLYKKYFPLTKVKLKPKRKKSFGLQMELHSHPKENKIDMKNF